MNVRSPLAVSFLRKIRWVSGKNLCKRNGKERMGIKKRQLNGRYLMICDNLYTLHQLNFAQLPFVRFGCIGGTGRAHRQVDFLRVL